MIKAIIQCKSDLHISSGFHGKEYGESLCIRDAEGNPFIPGHIIKKAIREACFKLAQILGFPECRTLSDTVDDCECLPCLIFGNASRQGNYLFSNGILIMDSCTGVHLRPFNTSGKKVSYRQKPLFLEVISAGTEFECEIIQRQSCINNDTAALLLTTAILWTKEIGNYAARGFGHCTLTITDPFIDNEYLKSALQILTCTNSTLK